MATRLRFAGNGRFRIVQFTDTHFWDGSRRDARTQRLMRRVLAAERPALVVLTGDLIEGARSSQPVASLRRAVTPMLEQGIPWAAVFGNHDDEGAADRRALLRLLRALPLCLTRAGPARVSGLGNFVLEIAAAKRASRPAALLYFLDSHAYSATGAGTYAWFAHDQVAWYRRTSARLAARGEPLPALAFFHIPLPEYGTAWEEGYDVRGARREHVCSPSINAGMFAAFHERGDMIGAFCGHDHLNDFAATLHGVRLCYGRASGFGGYGRRGLLRGARVIELRQGQRGFATWLRLEDGRRVD